VGVLIIIPIILAVDALVVYAIASGMASTWNTMARKYPGTEPAPGAVRRNFQSFSIGIFNMGWCVHVAVDDDRLHLLPARVMRWAGARAISVPWEEVAYVRPVRWGKYARVRIGRQELTGPAWALDLAKDAAGGAGAER
jgi:hypothetical protein